MQSLSSFRFEKVTGEFVDPKGYRVQADPAFRLEVRDASDVVIATWIDTEASWKGFFEIAADVLHGKSPREEVVHIAGFGLLGADRPAIGLGGLRPAVFEPVRDARGLIDPKASAEKHSREAREHALASAGFGLAPMKAEGQKYCRLCESTACVNVGGTEPCPGSD